MRIDRLLANMGYGSRKEVRHLLKNRRVTINGATVQNQRKHVDPKKDLIKVNGETVNYRKYIYIMLNKPDGYVSATEDFHHETVIDLLPSEYRHFNPFPVGRLDRDTVGLLLITNDGKLAHQLTSPKKNIEKTYFAKVRGRVQEKDIQTFAKGIRLADGYHTKPSQLKILNSGQISDVNLTITEGKYHQVKRMFASIGKEVIYLKRIRIGKIKLDTTLNEGEFRELNETELAYCNFLKPNK